MLPDGLRPLGQPAQRVRRLVVGGEEGLQRQFRQRDVGGRAEHGEDADQVQHAGRGAQPQRYVDVGMRMHAFIERRCRVGLQFLGQRGQRRVAAGAHLLLQPVQQVAAPLRQVDDARRHALRMQAQAQHVDRRRGYLRRQFGQQQRHHAVAGHHVPVPVHRQRGVGLVRLQHAFDRLRRRAHLGVGQRVLAVQRRVAGGGEQPVALAQRHLQPVGQAQHHLAAGLRTAGFQETQVAGRDLRMPGQIQLAQAAPLAPFAQLRAHRWNALHARHDSAAPAARR